MSKLIFAKVEYVSNENGDECPSMKLVFDEGMDGIVDVISNLDEDCATFLMQTMVDSGDIVLH